MKRVRIIIGDVFIVSLTNVFRYFQYIGDDSTQLHSNVIRVFRMNYEDTETELRQVVQDEVDFHAHTVIRHGISDGLWTKIGSAKVIESTDPLFRHSWDYGKPEVKVSKEWSVWTMNEPMEHVGKLSKEFQHAEIGIVINSESIVSRIKTGVFRFSYPGF